MPPETPAHPISSVGPMHSYSMSPSLPQVQRMKTYADWAAGKLQLQPYQLADMRKYAEVRQPGIVFTTPNELIVVLYWDISAWFQSRQGAGLDGDMDPWSDFPDDERN